MAAVYKTQCPHCQAQFRISDQHLQQAKGAVRCGSCLQVFQANEHLVEQPAAPATPPASSASRWSLDEPPAAAPKPATTKKWALDDAPLEAEEEFTAAPLDDDNTPPAKDSSNGSPMGLGSLELSDSFMSLDGDEEDSLGHESFSDLKGAGRKNISEDSDESWAEKLLEELDEKPEPPPATADKMSLTPTDKSGPKPKAAKPQASPTASTKATSPEAEDPLDWAASGGGFFSDDDDALAPGNITLPPADNPRQASRLTLPMEALSNQHPELLKWGALSILLMSLLAIQYLAFNFQELARTPNWRPVYANLCSLLGCELPTATDLARIRGSNLVIRAHPSIPEALVVDVLIYNESHHPQPFPALELGFTNLQGQAVASRLFRPQEYLSANLATQPMPVDTPIRVTFEIADPGSNAQNYSLRFFPAEG